MLIRLRAYFESMWLEDYPILDLLSGKQLPIWIDRNIEKRRTMGSVPDDASEAVCRLMPKGESHYGRAPLLTLSTCMLQYNQSFPARFKPHSRCPASHCISMSPLHCSTTEVGHQLTSGRIVSGTTKRQVTNCLFILLRSSRPWEKGAITLLEREA